MSTENVMIIPLIMALLEIFKGFNVDKRFIPIISIVLGVGIAALTGEDYLIGLVNGLSAVGLYSTAKHALNREK